MRAWRTCLPSSASDVPTPIGRAEALDTLADAQGLRPEPRQAQRLRAGNARTQDRLDRVAACALLSQLPGVTSRRRTRRVSMSPIPRCAALPLLGLGLCSLLFSLSAPLRAEPQK